MHVYYILDMSRLTQNQLDKAKQAIEILANLVVIEGRRPPPPPQTRRTNVVPSQATNVVPSTNEVTQEGI